MVLRKSINQTDLWEIRDHLENTIWTMVKCYTLGQLSLIDWRDTRSVKTSWDYLPVRVDNWGSLSKFKNWKQKRPYMTFWIRVDEIKDLYNKRNKKKKLIEKIKYE